MRVPIAKSDGARLDRCAAVVLWRQHEMLPTSPDLDPALRSRNRAGHHPQPVAERPAARQAQQLGGDERPIDAEQARDLLRRAVQAGAIVLNEVTVL